ncbi:MULTISPECIES: LysR family transcriptional regulator [unclassified Variovorax]|uniref:LysR family transcriptional regulator n=1 Tax=unclassified Variovorax TaxID=663243 RepID=UPI00076C3D73|nr:MULTISPECIES: LysR family transcriptional regulator [unclassified Variovorax]KWT82838.1 Transcriptional regulator, LysR family [Variovorax sp. WDL1]PNG52427.1 HTH-type transcriptional regulator GltC [Variovorax sp. B4]PNG54967.1 HTH-type transcriptional regulator GltC [Variovorax sp. B2]VTV15988.1 HTH-type transcriptional regulator GltC [Variovorax sp. WDL1]
MDWDNLRFFLELARTGTLVSAARRLAVDHTTVARRIQALEKEIGTALFAREAGGHRLTEAGRRLQPQVEAMEGAFFTIESATPAAQEGLSGLVRIGATEGFGTMVLAPELARFAQQHPRLVIDLLAMPRLVHLSRREADIVISLERPARGPVMVSKLTDYVLRLYASADYLDAHPRIASREDLRGHTFISYVDDLLFSKELQYLDELYRPDAFALRSTSILAQHQAAAAGTGIAVLPAFLAGRDPRLRTVLPGEANFTRTFWISMPAESKHLARMQAVWGFLRETVEAQRAVLLPPQA